MRRWWNNRRFDLLEVSLVAFLAAFLGWAVTKSYTSRNPPLHEEAVTLRDRYYPLTRTDHPPDWIIRDFFTGRRDGVFLDVGASHYQYASNTYYLEKELGWSGLAVEPMVHFEPGYAKHRPRSRFMPFFVSDVSDQKVTMYTHGKDFLANSSDKSFVERFGKNPQEFVATSITLNDLLQKTGIERVDFMSMDIELSEPKALAGFDIKRYKPALVCIEGHEEVRQQILDYFAANGYTLLGKYLRADDENLYFTPLELKNSEIR